jgi:hypothetical protein
MSLFNRKTVLLPRQTMTVGEFDITVDGAYRNVKTFPLETKKGKSLFVYLKSDIGVDVSVVDAKGMDEKFCQAVKDQTIGPVPIMEKGTMALLVGVYQGDLAHIEIEVWME